MFGFATSMDTQPQQAHANTGASNHYDLASCSSWEIYRTTRECVDGNRTLVTEYLKRYCPNKGWEYKKQYYFINACPI